MAQHFLARWRALYSVPPPLLHKCCRHVRRGGFLLQCYFKSEIKIQRAEKKLVLEIYSRSHISKLSLLNMNFLRSCTLWILLGFCNIYIFLNGKFLFSGMILLLKNPSGSAKLASSLHLLGIRSVAFIHITCTVFRLKQKVAHT